MGETWKSIIGYEGLYEVSNHGHVRSLDRVVYHPRGGDRSLRGRPMKLTLEPGGYLIVNLCKNGDTKNQYVHRLVLKAFAGQPIDGAVCMHGDNDRQNNHISNLKWGSQIENADQCTKEGRRPKGEECYNSTLAAKQVLKIRESYAKGGVTQAQLAEQFKIGRSAVAHIIYRQSWKHI